LEYVAATEGNVEFSIVRWTDYCWNVYRISVVVHYSTFLADSISAKEEHVTRYE
jgi:hypothetical protein